MSSIYSKLIWLIFMSSPNLITEGFFGTLNSYIFYNEYICAIKNKRTIKIMGRQGSMEGCHIYSILFKKWRKNYSKQSPGSLQKNP